MVLDRSDTGMAAKSHVQIQICIFGTKNALVISENRFTSLKNAAELGFRSFYGTVLINVGFENSSYNWLNKTSNRS